MSAPTHHEDSVLFLIDGDLGGCNSSAILRAVLNSVSRTIRDWLVRKDVSYEVSVIVFNAEISFADEPRVDHMPHSSETAIYADPTVLLSFDRPSANDMLRLLWLGAELEDCDIDGRPLLDALIKPRFNRHGLQEGLKSALSQFQTLSAESKSHRRLVLITRNHSSPLRSVKFSLLVEHLIDKRVQIVPLLVTQDLVDTPTSLWKELFDQNFFYNTNLEGNGSSGIRWGTSMVGPKSSVRATLCPLILKPDESDWRETLLVAVKNVSERKRPIFRAQLVLGELRIGVSGHRMAAHDPNTTNCIKQTDQDVIDDSKNDPLEAPGELSSEEIGLFDDGELGADKVTALYNIFANPSPKFIVKSFINAWNLPDYGQFGDSVLITASDFQLAQSHRAFNSLHRCMVRSRRVAEVVYYRQCDPKSNLRLPVLGYLFAFNPSEADDYETVADGEEKLRSACCKSGFVFVPAPTLDELQLYNHEVGGILDISVLKSNMRAILKCFWSSQSYTPDIFPHPILQQTARVMEYLGLQLGTKESLGELGAIQDCTVPDYNFLRDYMASENAIQLYLQKASSVNSAPLAGDDIRPHPHYLPSAIESSLREQDHCLAKDDLELLVSIMVGQERWKKWIDRPPQTIRTFMFNYLKLHGLDCLIETVRCPHMVHDLVQSSLSHSRISDLPLAYKILVCMMYEKPLPETEKELRKVLQSILTKPVKRIRSENDCDIMTSTQQSTKKTRNTPSARRPVLNSETPDSTSLSTQPVTAVQQPEIAQLLTDFRSSPSSQSSQVQPSLQPNAQSSLDSPTEMQYSVTQRASLSGARRHNHERQPSLTTSMSSLYMVQQSEPPSFPPAVIRNSESVPSLASQVNLGNLTSQEESSLLDRSLEIPSLRSTTESQFLARVLPHYTGSAELATASSIRRHIDSHDGNLTNTGGLIQDNSRNRPAQAPLQDTKDFGLSNNNKPSRESSVADSQAEWVQRQGLPQTAHYSHPQMPSVVPPPRPYSPVPEGPHYIPLPWVRAIAFSTWNKELQPYEHVMLAELFGVDNRNSATVEHHLNVFFRNELNRRKASKLNDQTGGVRNSSDKTILFEFLNTTMAPKRLHDYVKEAFWQENNNDGSYMLTGIMLRTVSRMYGLPTNAPMTDIVRRLRKVFGNPIIRSSNSPDPKQDHAVVAERPESVSEEDDFSFEKDLPSGVSAREHRRLTRHQRSESLSFVDNYYTGIERLRHIITPEERLSLNKKLVSAIDTGDLVPLSAAQLQFICKRLRLRNDGSRKALIDRIKNELTI